MVCYERVTGLYYVKAPCGHIYDVGCITSLVRSATSDESLFPPRCCARPIRYDLFNALIALDVWKAFERASQEFSIVAKDRVYCPRPTCSKFLGSVKALPPTTACPTCRNSVCTNCRKNAHPLRRFCQQEDESGALQGLLEQNRWQRCPNCRAVVELNQGCYHITCRCRSQFCYLCSAPWKTCSCRQWDERMLFAEAERREDARARLRDVLQPQPVRTAAPVTAAPRPQPAVPVTAAPRLQPAAPRPQPAITHPNLHVQPGGNNSVTNASNEPRPVGAQLATHPSSDDNSIDQRAESSSDYVPPHLRGRPNFGQEGHGYYSRGDTRARWGHGWEAEVGSSQGYQSHQKIQERSTDDGRQKRIKELMERLRTDHDCNPHDWRKRNGGGECSECHHHLPLYLLVSTSIF